ncbi:hypothetical protein L7F22_024018 [Adiantum nelumboides]|nr:hypothetical protein [Adiantum nelumboides]
MAVSFPTFYGHHDENARDFMDSLEMAHLMAGRDQEEVKLRAFPLVLKGEARVWYDALAPPSKATWPTLYGAFLNKYGQGDTPKNLWKQLLQHCQGSLGDYNTYESKFTNLWERWAASLQGQSGAPNFLKRDKFVEGMFSTLKEKVEAKFPQTFEEAQEIATIKFKKLLYQERKSNCVKEREEIQQAGPLPRTSTGKQYILTATDYMTRWAEAASVARITAADVSKFVLDYICSRFGTPLEILSDRDPSFRADLPDALLENLSIKHVHSTPYYPQCNGLVEKTNGVLCQEALLPIEVELGSLRVLVRETRSSKEKLEQRILDLQRLELDREAAIDYYITKANKKREQFNNKVKEKKLEEGMLVMRYDSRLDLSHSKKFLQRWEGPYVIFKKFKNGSYRLQDLSGKIHKYPVNGWRLKELFQRIQPIKEKRQVSLDA